MPRRAFVADLNSAIANFSSNNVSKLRAGEEDGMINFEYQVQAGGATEVTIMVTDLGEYPESHMYMIYTNSENVPPAIHSALNDMSTCQGLTVSDMLCKVAKRLDKATSGSRDNPVDLDNPDPMELDSDHEPEQSDEPEDDDSDAGAWSPKSPRQYSATATSTNRGSRGEVTATNARIRQDIRTVKEAGFRVGYLGSLFDGGRDGFLAVSCRIAKLGISDEALQAWHLESSQYFTILIKYSEGYKTLDSLVGSGFSHGSNGVQIRVGVTHKYKVSLGEAIAAFATLEEKSTSKNLGSQKNMRDTKNGGLGRLFIGRPLDDLLNDRLVPLLRYRLAMGFPWGGAEDFFNDHQGRNLTEADGVDTKYWGEDGSQLQAILPNIVTRDHLADNTKQHSFPLLVMQFALRHLVRCTEFCLVCHCKVQADFEALKPYVCSKPLCLYQYMSLGFGPSIEHEIITQPHVVDLLISFCYTSARNYKLRYLPTGMALMVPSPSVMPGYDTITARQNGFPEMSSQLVSHFTSRQPPKETKEAVEPRKFKAKFDRQKLELLFSPGATKVLNPGNWITFVASFSVGERYHCRVTEVLHPTVKLSPPVIKYTPRNDKIEPRATIGISQRQSSGPNAQSVPPALTPAATPPPPALGDTTQTQLHEIEFVIYDENFDDLSDSEKQISIYSLLDTLPSVKAMSEHLQSKGGQELSLRNWADRISPAALGLLRWIIASNRSCIIQVDSLDGSARKSEERVSGMRGWMQFRFAQGAPDKEQRFVTSIKNATNQEFPTMFAWHGSPLHNWHGIVREGLHFERSDHGRAYGNGVYHSLQAQTSLGYCMASGYHRYGSSTDEPWRRDEWPQSQLRISQAIALNEIVNAPEQFVSKSPHLVVAQLDWIQSRYLFVRCNTQVPVLQEDASPSQVYDQDKNYRPTDDSNKPIIIPITAVSKSRRKTAKTGQKRKAENVQEMEEAALVSDETDTEDLTILFSEDEELEVLAPITNTGKGKARVEPQARKLDASKTNFVPGCLDHKSLTLLEPPSYATPIATKTLQHDLSATLKVQSTHPAHELGWYIDGELITNVYQWIVELHSFESHLPLAKDLESRGLKSVVIEIRFGKDYPMSPPFVRVIRPRFLSFQAGGGGHVTAGGALCMELLTNSGWSAVSNIESVLLQVRLAMSSTDPMPARLEPGPVKDYQVREAVEAFIRACNAHGWEIPADFRSAYSA